MVTPKTYPRARHVSETDHTWIVDPNDVWTVPSDDVRFELTQRDAGGGWKVTATVRGLAMDKDGTIYGLRTMSDVQENGYFLDGRVSIDGVRRKAFTSDALFLDASGKLVKIAVLHVITTQPAEVEAS